MKNYLAPIFGLIFISVFCYLAWNNFELPSLLFGDTTKTKGKIIDIHIGHGVKGIGYIQNVKYAYSKDGKYYVDSKKVGKSYSWQNIGNRVLVEYDNSNPEKNNVEGFYDDYNSKNEESYLSSKKNGYFQISIINNIFFFNEFADYGVMLKEIIGESYKVNDTLIVKPYFIDKQSENLKEIKYLTVTDSIGKKQLIEIATKRVYKK
jgi:hypothetical protein